MYQPQITMLNNSHVKVVGWPEPKKMANAELIGPGDEPNSWVYRYCLPEQDYRPLWVGCPLRIKESRTEPCGCKYEIAICQHPQSEHNGKQVFPRVCRACPLKKD